MPLITLAAAAYVAGLLAAFGGRAPLAVASAGCAAALLALVGRAREGALAIVLAAGALSASAAEGRARRCAEALQRQQAWLVQLDRDAIPGGVSGGTTAGDCAVRTLLLLRSGQADAGSVVLVRGEAVRAQAGLQLRDAHLAVVSPPPLTWRTRNRIGRVIDARFGVHAPLVRALVVAESRGISPTERERFAAAGLAHMLSVSGLHVGIIALALSLLFQALRVPRPWAVAGGVVCVAAYVAMIGAPAPALRAAAMLVALGVSRLAQRPTSTWALLGVGALLPLHEPAMVLRAGYQLSVLGVASLCAAGALERRASDRLPALARFLAVRWRREVVVGLAGSTIATAASIPLVAWHFGVVSLVGPASNLVAAPLIAVLQPALFLALLLEPLPPLASLAAAGAQPMLWLFGWIADRASGLPGASVPVLLSTAALVPALGAVGCLLAACVSPRCTARWVAGGATCIALLVWWPTALDAGGRTELHMLDVGQGDAVAIRTARGRWLLFDAGRVWKTGDAGRFTIVPYLRRRGGPLQAFILSHPHADHVGGARSVIGALRPRQYLDPGFATGGTAYVSSLRLARELGVAWTRVRPADSLVVDEVVVRFLAPDSAWTARLDDPNDASTVALVRVGAVRILLTGDAEAEEERWLLARGAEALRADVLKVAHHGSATSSGDAWLDAVQPSLALVSVGAGNSYRHPSADRMRALARRGALVLRTDQLGTIVLRTDGERIAVSAAGETWDAPTRTARAARTDTRSAHESP